MARQRGTSEPSSSPWLEFAILVVTFPVVAYLVAYLLDQLPWWHLEESPVEWAFMLSGTGVGLAGVKLYWRLARQREEAKGAGLVLKRSVAVVWLAAGVFAFPAVAVLMAGLAMGFSIGRMVVGLLEGVGVFGTIFTLLFLGAGWWTLSKHTAPAPATARYAHFPPWRTMSGASILLASAIVGALIVGGKGGDAADTAGFMAGLMGGLAVAPAAYGVLLIATERKRSVHFWSAPAFAKQRVLFTTTQP